MEPWSFSAVGLSPTSGVSAGRGNAGHWCLWGAGSCQEVLCSYLSAARHPFFSPQPSACAHTSSPPSASSRWISVTAALGGSADGRAGLQSQGS